VSGCGSELGMVANIIWAKSAPGVDGSTMRRDVPTGDLMRNSCRLSELLRQGIGKWFAHHGDDRRVYMAIE
jgi:hypothetical protein